MSVRLSLKHQGYAQKCQSDVYGYSKPPGMVPVVGPPGISTITLYHSLRQNSLPWLFFFVVCLCFVLSCCNYHFPPVPIVSSASSTTITVTMAPTFMELADTLGQLYVVSLPPLIPSDTIRGVVGLATVLQQQPNCQTPSQAYANYVMGPSQVSFFFKVEPPISFLIGVCYGVCCLLSGSSVTVRFTNKGSTTGACTTATL